MLTRSQINAFNADGFLVVEDVVTDMLPTLRNEYETLMDDLWEEWALDNPAQSFEDRIIAGYRAGCEYFQPMDISLPLDNVLHDTPMHTGAAVFGLMRHPKLLDVVESLIGPEITSNPIQHVRIKPPVTDMRDGECRAHISKTDWHQDRGVTQEVADQTQMITAWVAVSDATVENGCLQAIKCSHKGDLLPHCPLEQQVGIPMQFIDEGNVTPLPVKAGGVILFHPMTAHASLDNNTDGVRWSFDLRYNVTGQATGRAQFPEFVARSAQNPQSELRSAKDWAASWSRTRDTLSRTPIGEFYRWDHNAPYCA
jgi:hypothetical protein